MSQPAPPLETIAYVIDPTDRIRQVTPNWDAFAQTNGAPQLTLPAVLDRSIWDYITGAGVRSLYHDLFQFVRRKNQPLTFSFRCDAPATRRFMEMQLVPNADGAITLRSRTLHVETRPPIALLTLPAHDGPDSLEICSFCKQAHLPDDTWAPLEDTITQLDLFGEIPIPDGITHSVCPTCLPDLQRRLGL